MQNNVIHIISFSVKQWETDNAPTADQVAAGFYFGIATDNFTDNEVF